MSSGTEKTLLLVEDEALVALSESVALTAYGYAVITVRTGEQAVETIGRPNDIDLILMDIDLGKGIDGTQAAEIILKDHDIPIVFVSSHSEREIVQKTEKITSYGYVVKSSSITVLDASIKMAFKLFEANRNMKAVNEKLEATFEALPDLIFEIGLDGTFHDIHASNSDLLFKTVDEHRNGKTIFDILPPETASIVMSAIMEAHEKGGSFGKQYELAVHAGLRWFEISVSRMVGEPSEPHFIYLCHDISERKKIEDALRESEVRLRSILDATPFPIALVDVQDNNILYWSKSAHTLFGHTAPTATEWYQMAYPDPEYRQDVVNRWKPFLDKAQSSGETVNTGEYRVSCADGSVRICELYATFLSDKLIVTFNDITERKKAEVALQEKNEEYEVVNEELRLTTEELQAQNEQLQTLGAALEERESKYRMLAENSSDIVSSLDGNGTYIYVNDYFASVAGRKAADIIGKSLWDVLPGPDADARYEVVKKAIKTGGKVSFEMSVPMKDGRRYFSSTANPVRDKAGKAMLVVIHGTDITERKKAEEALHDSEGNLKTAQSIAHIGSWKWGVEKGEVEWSDEMFRIFGVDKETNTGRLGDIAQNAMHPDDLHLVLPANAANIANMPFEYRIVLQDGSIRNIWAKSGNTVFDSLGRPLSMSGVAQDITERKIAEGKIKSLLAEKELMLREVHHRIKNNMRTMVSLLSLQGDSMKEPIAIDALKDAENRLRSMEVLYDRLNQTDSFMDVSAKEYLPSLVEEVVKVFPAGEKVSVKTRIDDFRIPAKEISSLGIIVNEVVTNAMKHAFAGKTRGVISIAACKNGKRATIRISDDGVGLPKSVDIETSSGFGMILIGTLARQMKGTMRIERNEGTAFILEFDLVSDIT